MFDSLKSWWKRATKSKTKELDLKPDLIIPTKDKEDPEEIFVKKFTQYGGKFFYCENKESAIDELKNILSTEKSKEIICFDEDLKNILNKVNKNYKDCSENTNNEIAFIKCEMLIAFDGSILVTSSQTCKKKASELPSSYIFYAEPNQITKNISIALEKINRKYNEHFPTNISCIKKDIQDVNKSSNPKEIYLLLVENY